MGNMVDGIGQFGGNASQHEIGQCTETFSADGHRSISVSGFVNDIPGDALVAWLHCRQNTSGWKSAEQKGLFGLFHKSVDLGAATAFPLTDLRLESSRLLHLSHVKKKIPVLQPAHGTIR